MNANNLSISKRARVDFLHRGEYERYHRASLSLRLRLHLTFPYRENLNWTFFLDSTSTILTQNYSPAILIIQLVLCHRFCVYVEPRQQQKKQRRLILNKYNSFYLTKWISLVFRPCSPISGTMVGITENDDDLSASFDPSAHSRTVELSKKNFSMAS